VATLPFQNGGEQQGKALTTTASMMLSIVFRWFLASPFRCMLHLSFFSKKNCHLIAKLRIKNFQSHL
jgi:hypothetical protein